MLVKIVTDSVSDISHPVAEELGITVIPLNVVFGNEIFRDGVDLTTEEFYRKLENSQTLPTTSTPSLQAFIELYEKLAERYPNSDQADDALYSMAWAFLVEKKKKEAVAHFQRVVAEYPESDFAPHAQFTLGDYYYNESKYEQALSEYQKVQELYPQDEIAGRVPDLIQDLRETVAYLDYEQVMGIFRQAVAENDMDKFREAVSGFQEIIEKYPDTESEVGALSNMGISYEYLHEWRGAVDAYGKVLDKYTGPDTSR